MSDDRAASAGGFHQPVLVDEVLRFLEPSGDGLYLDGTVGGGGHARAILEACASCRLLAVDRDPEALREARSALAAFTGRVRFLEGTFDVATSDIEVGDVGLAGALLDLGVSSHQIDDPGRGFTFARGAALDMRMEGGAGGRTGAELLNDASEGELSEMFREFGEERRHARLARVIVRRREERPFATADDLVAALSSALGASPTMRDKARVFQAVRIAVNRELELLASALPGLRDALVVGAVIVVISYHSLEDRIVKNLFREWSRACVCPPGLPVCRCRGEPLGETLTRKPVRPTEEEVSENSRARSARLRAWRKAA